MRQVLSFVLLAVILSSCSKPTSLPVVTANTEEPTEIPTVIPSATVSLTPSPVPTPTQTPIPHYRYVSVLLGSDWDELRPERVQFGVRSDVFIMMIADIYGERLDNITFFSIPRDLWVKVPCSPLDPALEGYDRVNAAWAYGQFDCVAETVALNFPFEITAPMFYIEFDGFIALINKFGGLDVTSSRTYTDWCGTYHGTAGVGGEGEWYTWKEGYSYHMDGEEALCYVRARRGASEGDLDRNRRALDVMMAMLETYPPIILDDPVAKAWSLWEIANDYIRSDLSLDDVVRFAPYIADAYSLSSSIGHPYYFIRLTLDEVKFWTTPIYGASVLLPKVDLKGWTTCMFNNRSVESDPRPYCTELSLLEEFREEGE